MDVSEWFPVTIELGKGCVMSPLLFNLYMHGVVREVNARPWLGKRWNCYMLMEAALKYTGCYIADDAIDTTLVAESEVRLCRLVSEFGRVCERRKLRVNVGKSKMRCTSYVNVGRMHVRLNGEPLEEVDWFKLMGSQVAADWYVKGTWYTEWMWGIKREPCKSVRSNRGLGINANNCKCIVPTALYAAVAWGMIRAERRKVNALEMKRLKSFVGVWE